MNEEQYRYLISRPCQYAREKSDEPIAAGRRMREGKICSSCKSALPAPHLPDLKRCEFCSTKHLVYMYFRKGSGWHCGFRTEARKKLPRELTFNSSATARKLARRPNGLIDDWDRRGFEIDLEVGRGGIWLRITDEQHLALGGLL